MEWGYWGECLINISDDAQPEEECVESGKYKKVKSSPREEIWACAQARGGRADLQELWKLAQLEV